MRPVIVLAIALCFPVGLLAQTATLSLSGVPSAISPGDTRPITVSYTADIHETNRRGVLLLEVLDAGTGDVLLKLDANNDLQGFEGPSGEHTFDVTLPDSLPPAIAFRAYMTVFGINDWVQQMIESYPTDGTYTYEWTGNGVTRDLFYLGGLVISNNTDVRTYCSGMTYEVFLRTNVEYRAAQGISPQIGDIVSTSNMRNFRRLWYGATGIPIEDEFQSTLGIERENLGFILVDFDDARAGDFCQFWRHSGSGHSPIFQNWNRDNDGDITGMRYWGSQSSTNGLGYRSESVAETFGIDPDRLHLARVMKPRGPDDWTERFGDADTMATPTQVGFPGNGVTIR